MLLRPVPAPKVKSLQGCNLADLRARELLSETAGRRKIQSNDLLRALETWKFKPNKKRLNVMPTGVCEICSEMLGLVRVRVYSKFVVAARSRTYPNVTKMLTQYFLDNPPAGLPAGQPFPFTTVCLNKNYAAKRHRDRNNVGLSVVRALGDFTGGRLRYWPHDDTRCDVSELHDTDSVVTAVKDHTLVMNSTQAHAVEDFQGTRYSLVYFTVTNYERALPEVGQFLAANCNIKLIPFKRACKVWQTVAGDKALPGLK